MLVKPTPYETRVARANWVGGIQERNYKIEGKTLSVSTTPTLVNGKEQVGYLIFERV
jgi:hypothetical protein